MAGRHKVLLASAGARRRALYKRRRWRLGACAEQARAPACRQLLVRSQSHHLCGRWPLPPPPVCSHAPV